MSRATRLCCSASRFARVAVLGGMLIVTASVIALAQERALLQAPYVLNGCHQCHGYGGQGSVAGPRIAPSVYPFAAFAQLVRRPPNEMPAYAASVLSDEDLLAIYDYVRTMPEPPALDDIRALR